MIKWIRKYLLSEVKYRISQRMITHLNEMQICLNRAKNLEKKKITGSKCQSAEKQKEYVDGQIKWNYDEYRVNYHKQNALFEVLKEIENL